MRVPHLGFTVQMQCFQRICSHGKLIDRNQHGAAHNHLPNPTVGHDYFAATTKIEEGQG